MTTSSGSVRREQTGDMTHPQDVTIHDGIRYYPDSPDGEVEVETYKQYMIYYTHNSIQNM